MKKALILLSIIILSCSPDSDRVADCGCEQEFYEVETTVVGGHIIRTDTFLYSTPIECTDEIDREFYSGYEFYNIVCNNGNRLLHE